MLNKVQSKTIEVTPYGIWNNKEPCLSYIKVWGYPTYVKRIVSDKLKPKSDKCLFVGYLLKERVSSKRRQLEHG